MKKMLLAILLIIPCLTVTLPAQEMPDWAKNRTIDDKSNCYFGIGKSSDSEDAADDVARQEFAKSIKTHVETMMKEQIKEKNYKVDEKYERESLVKTDLSLQGITITERYHDKNAGIWYSLIKYEKDEYDKIMKAELDREIERLKKENKVNEDKRLEALRHETEITKIETAEREAELKKRREQEALKEKQLNRVKERFDFIFRNYSSFINTPAYHRLINMENAEIIGGKKLRQEASVRGGFYPANFSYLKYSANYQVMAVSIGVHSRADSLLLEDAFVKLRLLNGQGKVYRTSVAIGFGQYIDGPLRISNLSDDLKDSVNIKYSVASYANVHIPQYYLNVSTMVDFRKASVGAVWYPFFKSMENKLGFMLEIDTYFNNYWRNRHDDAFVVSPGIQFVVIPHKFYSQIAYEQNEYFTLAIDYQF